MTTKPTGRPPVVKSLLLDALQRAGIEGRTSRDLAEQTGHPVRNVSSCLQNIRDRDGGIHTLTRSKHWARHYSGHLPLAECQAHFDAWVASLHAARDAGYKAARQERDRIKAEGGHAERVQAELAAARQRRAAARQVADQLRKAKASEAVANNILAKRIKGTTQPSLAPVKPSRVTVVMPPDVKVTKCPSPPGRFELLQPAEGGLRSLPIGSYLEKPSAWLQAAGVAA